MIKFKHFIVTNKIQQIEQCVHMKLFEGVTLRSGLEKTGNVFKTVQCTQQMLINLELT